MTKTDWYPGNIKPVRSGWYERIVGYRNDFYCTMRGRWFTNPNGGYLLKDNIMWRGITEPFCKYCKTKMQESKAIAQTYTGAPDFPGDKHCVTLSPGGKGKLIDCYKCPLCGWSVTK